MNKTNVLIIGLSIIATISIYFNFQNAETKQVDFVSDYLINNNQYQKNRVSENLKQLEMASILNPPKMKKKYSNFMEFDSNVQDLIDKLENPNFDFSSVPFLSREADSLFFTIVNSIEKDDIEDLAYFENNLFAQWEDLEQLKSRPFRLQIVNNLLNSEVYYVNYILMAGQWDFTNISPMIETIGPELYRLTLAAYDTRNQSSIFIGAYDSTNFEGYTEYFPKDDAKEIRFENGFAQIETNNQRLNGLIKYKNSGDDGFYYWPINRKLN